MMRILHLSWEYPPVVYGGLGRHVHALAEAQAALGHDVCVVTQAPSTAASTGWAASASTDVPHDEVVNGVRVIRVDRDPPVQELSADTLLSWAASLESAMSRRILRSDDGIARADLVHAHDWMVAHTAVLLRAAWEAPLVTTLHATEAGRHQGWLPGDLSRAIHAVEGWLAHSSDAVVTCSAHMRGEVSRLFAVENVDVIPNGIDTRHWRTSARDIAAARERYAPHGPLVAYCGRLEWEKGVHTFVDALPRLRRRFPSLRVVIAGHGGASRDLEQQARERRVAPAVEFTGWLPERELHALMAAADALVVPSLYEPFGLVALEGAALGAPLVVARSGGLVEFVEDGVTGRTFATGDPADLARAVTECLDQPDQSRAWADEARRRVRDDHPWDGIARRLDAVYAGAVSARADRTGEVAPFATPPASSGNLLYGGP